MSSELKYAEQVPFAWRRIRLIKEGTQNSVHQTFDIKQFSQQDQRHTLQWLYPFRGGGLCVFIVYANTHTLFRVKTQVPILLPLPTLLKEKQPLMCLLQFQHFFLLLVTRTFRLFLAKSKTTIAWWVSRPGFGHFINATPVLTSSADHRATFYKVRLFEKNAPLCLNTMTRVRVNSKLAYEVTTDLKYISGSKVSPHSWVNVRELKKNTLHVTCAINWLHLDWPKHARKHNQEKFLICL